MTSVYTMLKDLAEFMERNNVKLNHANEIVNGVYSISLTWKPTEHDGSVCQKLPLDDIGEHHVDKKYMQVMDKMPLHDTPVSVELKVQDKPTPVPTVTTTTTTTTVGSPIDTIQVSSSADNKEEVEAWNKLGKKESSEVPDDDGEVPIKKDELKDGDRVVYYGADASRKGMQCTVVKVTNHGYTNTVAFDDNCVYNQVSLTQLRRKVNGA